MHRTLELAGPITMIATVVCAEAGARALADWPSSSVLWYLNLDVFRSFQYSFATFGFAYRLSADQFAQPLWIGAPLLGLVCLGLGMQLRLACAWQQT